MLAAVVEVQLDEDSDKAFTWPAYVAGARLRFRCDAVLVVIALDQRVANWARQPIAFGRGAGHLQALVLGPNEVPAVMDVAVAKANPELAVVSAIAHGRDADIQRAVAIAAAATGAALSVEGERGLLYYDLIKAALSSAARKAFDMLPSGYQFQDEGLRNAMAKGKTEGKAEGKAESVLAVLQARGLTVTQQQRERILACNDATDLDRWLRTAVTASSAESLFAH